MFKTSLQFELWEECNNRCKFCYLQENNRKTDPDIKVKSLEKTIAEISNLNNYKKYNVLSYIGGEFFQGQLNRQDVRDLFFKLIDKTNWLLENHYIDEVWMNATLTTEDQRDLHQCLHKFSDLTKVWICTSYDTIGRFHTIDAEDRWKKNVKDIQAKYPGIKTNVTMIVTNDLITKILSHEFSFEQFKQDFNCALFLKTPYAGTDPQTLNDKIEFEKTRLTGFFPTRLAFLKFLVFLKNTDEELLDKIYNICYRADDLYKNTEGNKEKEQHFKRVKDSEMNDVIIHDTTNNVEILPLSQCGHRSIYTPYIDSNECFICDKERLGL